MNKVNSYYFYFMQTKVIVNNNWQTFKKNDCYYESQIKKVL